MVLPTELQLQHPVLDGQHERLLMLLAAAADAAGTGTAAEARAALDRFVAAMLDHTSAEEAIMEESLFPDRGRHRAAHELFLSDLQQLAGELARTGPTPQVAEWLRVRIPEWLHFHIAVNDAKLGAHLAQRPAAGRGGRRGDARRPSS